MLDLSHTLAAELIEKYEYPWQMLSELKEFIVCISGGLGDDYEEVAPSVWAHKTVKIAPSAFLGERVIIGAGTEVRHCAFIRGGAIIGENCVVGNSVEIKNSVLFDGVQAPHFNYVGDSILGYKSHMGAGSVTSNVKSDKSPITAHMCGVTVKTGLKKFGAVLGDFAEIGCNCVLNPGTVVGRNCTVYPLSSVRGEVPKDSIYKSAADIVSKK